MPGPAIPQNSGKEFYAPGAVEAEYNKIQGQPGLPGVSPPAGATTGAPPSPALSPSGPVDLNAPDGFQLISGSRFKQPFTVTLMRRSGIQTFKSDAGTKTEAAYELCKETIRNPSDILRLTAGIRAEVYKPLNEMSLEFQLMLYLAHAHGVLDTPAPAAAPDEEATIEA